MKSRVAELERRASRTRLYRYKPYAKQLRFHAVGGDHEVGPDCPPGCQGKAHRERLLMGANQSGKTVCGGAEATFHATGEYPSWWTGKRFKRPTRGWVAGDGFEGVRDGAQRILIGDPAIESDWGTGLIPGDLLLDWSRASGGVPNVLSSVLVRHVPTGGVSTVGFKSFDQGRRKFQGETLDWFWPDEEPPEDIYTEGLTRTNATAGILFMTFTPMEGMTQVVHKFIEDVGGLR